MGWFKKFIDDAKTEWNRQELENITIKNREILDRLERKKHLTSDEIEMCKQMKSQLEEYARKFGWLDENEKWIRAETLKKQPTLRGRFLIVRGQIHALNDLIERELDEPVPEELREEVQEAIQGIDKELQELKNHITTNIALANLGAEKYGNPTIKYKGIIYNSTGLLKILEKQLYLDDDDLIACKMMYYKLKEHVEKLQPVDEYGNIVLSQDEALNKYLLYASLHVKRLEKLIENNSK